MTEQTGEQPGLYQAAERAALTNTTEHAEKEMSKLTKEQGDRNVTLTTLLKPQRATALIQPAVRSSEEQSQPTDKEG